MKYGVWTSSKYNNTKFNKEFHRTGGNVFFLFTCMTRTYFVGMAKMISIIDYEKEFAYWGELGKWRGLGLVSWVLVKEVPFE